MKRGRSYQQNSIQNFEIEQEFDQLMQIQGLSSSKDERRQVFPSIKHLFHPKTTVNIVGEGPNANIRSFYYLLLCHIRKEHFKRLINEKKQKELNEFQSEEDAIGRRERKVSFNGKGAIFLNGPQYENYALHKLRMFAFSRQTDLKDIQHSPFDSEVTLRFKGRPMTSLMLKKLLSQFLRQILPGELPLNYKEEIRSIRYHLNQHKCVGIILTVLMRHILLSKYEIESARRYDEEINDHTVCTTLCDAFAIDGLLCKDNLYEINTWCKVYSLNYGQRKTFFIEMFNDEFEELGSVNDKRKTLRNFKEVKQEFSISSYQQSSSHGRDILINNSGAFGVESSEKNSSRKEKSKSQASSSMMAADQDSEISYGGQEWRRARKEFKAVESEQYRSMGDQRSNSNNNTFRQTFSNKFTAQMILNQIQREQEESKMKAEEASYEDELIGKVCGITQHEEANLTNEPTQEYSYKFNDYKEEEEEKRDFSQASEESNNPFATYERESPQKKEKPQEYSIKPTEPVKNYEDDCTPSDLMEKLNSFKTKSSLRVFKIGSRDNTPNIVNNNISNNIYVSLSHKDSQPYLIPVINISSKEATTDPNSYIKINLV